MHLKKLFMNKQVRLGINLGFAVNRFPEPEVWARIVGEFLGLRYAQFAADLLNPSLPDDIIAKELKDIREACARYNVNIEHTFTSGFTRVNHLAHPRDYQRRYWVNWFKRYADISAALGAVSMGSHPAILSVTDLKDQARYEHIMEQIVKGWHEIAAYAKEKGLKYLTWEPMSVARELGETIEKARALHARLNDGSSLPIKFCLDLDHGDLASLNPDDTDPYAWMRHFAHESPILHLKQAQQKSGNGHHPFIEPYNSTGKIQPEKVLQHLDAYGADDTLLLFELSFKEREPAESNILPHLKGSVDYWRPFVSV